MLIGSPDLKANHRITQIFDFPAEHEKYPKLVRILEKVRVWRGGVVRGEEREIQAGKEQQRMQWLHAFVDQALWLPHGLSCGRVAARTQEMDGRRILIFLETKKGCDAVTRQLRMDGWPALSIHGDKSQHERDWVLAEFKAGKHPIMIATDVAARGLGRPGARRHPLSASLLSVSAVRVSAAVRLLRAAWLAPGAPWHTGGLRRVPARSSSCRGLVLC